MSAEKRSRVIRATDTTFERRVLGSARPVLVHFWAPWHAPCVALAARLEELAARFEGRVDLVKVNLAENPRLASRYHTEGTPALVFLRRGEVVRVLPPAALAGKRLGQVLEAHAQGEV